VALLEVQRADPTSGAAPIAPSWVGAVARGALAGLAGALGMTLLFLVLRDRLGLPTPSELVGDRLTAYISIAQFFALLDRFGGYNGLKQAGGGSVIAGQIVVGVLAGALYASTVRPRGALDGRLVAAGIVGVLWLLTLALLWPNLGTNALGLPPGPARVATTGGLLVCYAAYGLLLVVGYAYLQPRAGGMAAPVGFSTGRRSLLLGGLAAALAVAAGGAIQQLVRRATFSYDGTEYRGGDVQPITPNDRFYSVTKNIVDPNPSPAVWRLEIAGLVEQPRTYTFDEIAALPAVTQETTLMCISNYLGGGLMSNAVWRGLPLRDLLTAAGPKAGVAEVVLHGADGYTDTFPLDKALEPTTFVAYEMNGEPLPVRHGYPVRILTPGLFGEKSVKWVTRIELVDHDVKGFYEQQGWGPSFVIPNRTTFIFGDFETAFSPGSVVPVRGNAFAGNRGVARVDVSADEGRTWQEARIDYPGTDLTWVFWTFDFRPPAPGSYTLIARATDRQGGVQTGEYHDTQPQGATGFPSLHVRLIA
jgi:DMSO/TMAO reductase YedYZ molybdopterin-dependent catalytic subunit